MSIAEARPTVMVPLDEIAIIEQGFNSRRETITPGSIRQLQEDIGENGLDQPVHLIPVSNIPGKKYRVMAGFRRTRAVENLGWKAIPAFIRDDIKNEDEARIFNIRENIQRKNLTIVDEAYSIKPFLDNGAPIKWIAEKIGMSPRWVEQRVIVGKLPDIIQTEISANPTWFKQGHIERLIEMGTDFEKQQAYVHDIKTHAARGETLPPRGPNKSKLSDKRKRTVSEIEELLNAIYDCIGPGIETRLLAWAAGNISNSDIINDMNTVALDRSTLFVPPENLLEM